MFADDYSEHQSKLLANCIPIICMFVNEVNDNDVKPLRQFFASAEFDNI